MFIPFTSNLLELEKWLLHTQYCRGLLGLELMYYLMFIKYLSPIIIVSESLHFFLNLTVISLTLYLALSLVL